MRFHVWYTLFFHDHGAGLFGLVRARLGLMVQWASLEFWAP